MSEATATIWYRMRYTRLRDALRGRFDASLDWRGVVGDAQLPTEVADTITAVVRKTRLWRGEKVDVARELVAHFQDGLEAGRTPPQLVATFGDPAAAALLIRRAKKRGRPVAWRVLRACVIGYIAFSLVYLLVGLFVMAGRPTLKIDYLALINQRAESVPEAERAWPLYRDALQQMQMDRQFPKWTGDTELAPGDADWQEAVAWLDSHAAALAIVRDAAKRRDLGFSVDASPRGYSEEDRRVLIELQEVVDEPEERNVDPAADRLLLATLLPHLEALRSLARVLTIDARRAANEGDGATALADVYALVGLSRHASETPFLVNTLVAISFDKMAFAAVEETLRHHPGLWTDAQLRDLAHTLGGARIDWKRGFSGERAIFDDVIQRIYTDDGQGDGRPVLSGFGIFRMMEALTPAEKLQTYPPPSPWWSTDGGALLAAPAATLVLASRKEMTDTYERFLNGTIERMERPLWDSGPDPEAELNAMLDGAPMARWRYWLVAYIAPSLEHIRLAIATWEGQRDGVLVGLALELYHREHGVWPESLEELSPRWLPTVPVDRITGRPLGYKIVDDRPVVYSAGADQDDDGGRVPLDDDGRPNRYRASPVSIGADPRDGDWVIWSTCAAE